MTDETSEAPKPEPRVLPLSIGRKVWYWRRPQNPGENNQPEDATVVYVWNERMVNLFVIDHNGRPRAETSIVFRQPDDLPPGGAFAEWMPYQVGQAAKEKLA